MTALQTLSYCDAIRSGFHHLLSNYREVFAIGQGLWAPWYVGNSMLELEKEFGRERIIDSPVSEAACTGAAIGASLCGYRPIVVHPRLDFLLMAADQVVNQAAKWHFMTGGARSPALTIRAIINRGGEQGAQHSQALHSWFAHIPGLKVVMPATPQDARDLLIASVLDDSPVLYIDDRWLYGETAEMPHEAAAPRSLRGIGPAVLREGTDLTIAASGFSTRLALNTAEALTGYGISAEVVDLRIINPLNTAPVEASVRKTGRLAVIDGGWMTCGLAGEIIARISESLEPGAFKGKPVRITLPDAPAPSSPALESIYYPGEELIVQKIRGIF